MDPELKKMLETLTAGLTTLSARMDAKEKADEQAKKDAEEAAKKKKEEEESDAFKAAQKKVEEQKKQSAGIDAEKAKFLNAVKFNANMKEFLESNKEYLPDTLPDVIKVLTGRTYDSDVDKAQEMMRAVVESYVAQQANIDLLPESFKTKAEKYAGLTTKEKLAQADSFYDIVETGLHTAKNIKKFEQLQKGGKLDGQGEAGQEYENKLIAYSKEGYGNVEKSDS